MARDVEVKITDAKIIAALNTAGGPVYEWRNRVERALYTEARAHSPVNDPLNAVHRGGRVGTYLLSWRSDHRGSSGHHVVARVYNTADHARFVEEGRGPSTGPETFSWVKWAGDIRTVTRNRGYDGQHVLRDAANRVGTELHAKPPLT